MDLPLFPTLIFLTIFNYFAEKIFPAKCIRPYIDATIITHFFRLAYFSATWLNGK